MNKLPWSATVQEVGIIPITICSLLLEVTIGEKLKNVKASLGNTAMNMALMKTVV